MDDDFPNGSDNEKTSQNDINFALKSLRGPTVTERRKGIDHLERIFALNGGRPKESRLKDAGYLWLLQELFQLVKSETPAYAKAVNKPSARAKSASVLSTYASAIRSTVEHGARAFERKTVKAVIDHIVQTSKTSGDTYCEPLVSDYLKSLRAILAWPAHPEHLSGKPWSDLVAFCVEGIENAASASEESSSFNRVNASVTHDTLPSRASTPGTLSRSRDHSFRSRQYLSQNEKSFGNKNVLEDWGACLACLYSTTNAPILEKLGPTFTAKPGLTLTAISSLLNSSSPSAVSQQDFFKPINSILAKSMLQDVDLTCSILRETVPLISRHWECRSLSGREEMLVTLVYGQAYFPRLLKDDNPDEDFEQDFRNLLDLLQEEYCKRSERDQIQIDDLELYENHDKIPDIIPLHSRSFALRLGALKAEPSWAILEVMASGLLFSRSQDARRVSVGEVTNPPQKRQKIASPIESILRQLRVASSAEKSSILQILAFGIDRSDLKIDAYQAVLDHVVPLIPNETSSVSNWSMFVVSCIACAHAVAAHTRPDTWVQALRVAARNITSVSLCQVSCHLLAVLLSKQLVPTGEVSDLAESILSSSDLNGPPILTERVATLWRLFINFRARNNSNLIGETNQRILVWLLTRWKPSNSLGYQNSAIAAQHCQAHSLLDLISAILGLSPHGFTHQTFAEVGSISRAKQLCRAHQKLVDYLLLSTIPSESTGKHPTSSDISKIEAKLTNSQFSSMISMLFDFLCKEIHFILQDPAPSKGHEGRILSVNVVHVLCTLGIVAFGFAKHSSLDTFPKASQLLKLASQLRDRLAKDISRHSTPQDLYGALIDTLGKYLTLSAPKRIGTNMLLVGALVMAKPFGSKFWKSLNSEIDSVDPMDLMGNVDSQGSRSGAESLELLPHDHSTALTCSTAQRESAVANISVFANLDLALLGDSDNVYRVSAAVAGYLVRLEPQHFLTCWPFIHHVMEADLEFDSRSADTILDYLEEHVIVEYEYERCEATLSLCLDVMISLVGLWTKSEDDEIFEHGSALYEWLHKIILERDRCSPHTYFRMSCMLQRVLVISPDYPNAINMPSARTSLFDILAQGSLPIKFEVGMNISAIFGMFILKEHHAILEDIIKSLPSDAAWTEGIALRLWILAHLASSWPTLLRRCFFAIFETPGRVPDSVEYAKHCVRKLACSLGLASTKELLRLFISQVTFTWLGTDSLETMPYQVFDYASLADYLNDNMEEFAGQIVMRGRDDEIQKLVGHVSTPFPTILQSHFAKAAAYSIARDTAMPPDDHAKASSARARLRGILGKEEYGAKMVEKLAEIVAICFQCMDQDLHFAKVLQKRSTYSQLADSYSAIAPPSGSSIVLPPTSQPCFKAGYVIDEVEYLCNRLEIEPLALWTPALYVFACRSLLDTIHDALGSLHRCAAIRKIRILISMAGDTALQGYPLEMTLRSLRPFLTDINCAEDVMGIFRYVLDSGSPYLRTVPTFFSGLLLSTLASMKTLLTAPQESTTQESQFVASLKKAQEFQAWLGDYGNRYESLELDRAAEVFLKTMLKAAGQLGEIGTSALATNEGDLLLLLLDDERSGYNLVDEPSRTLILDLLCGNFAAPKESRDDILGSNEMATRYASSVWNTCRKMERGSDYLAWAAGVLGKSYASSGMVHLSMLQEIDPERFLILEKPNTSSRTNIVLLLCRFLYNDKPGAASVAERTLQRIVTNYGDSASTSDFMKAIPNSLVDSLTWDKFGCPSTSNRFATSPVTLERSLHDLDGPFSEWTRQVCFSLISEADKDPLLGELPLVLDSIKEIPERIFAFILHSVLEQEFDTGQRLRPLLSEAFMFWLKEKGDSAIAQKRLLLHCLLYLRGQPIPRESTKSDRTAWLEIDYIIASEAAVECEMFKTALLFLEIGNSGDDGKASRRSSKVSNRNKTTPSEDLLLRIFRNLDDGDSFYGIQQPSSLASMMQQLEYENAGFKSLSFRGADLDGQIRLKDSPHGNVQQEMTKVLNRLDFNGLSQALSGNMNEANPAARDAMLCSARKLERWDIAVPESENGHAAILYKTFQHLNDARSIDSIFSAISSGLTASMHSLIERKSTVTSAHVTLASLAVMTEMKELCTVSSGAGLEEMWINARSRKAWMATGSVEHVTTIVSCRETAFSTLSKSKGLQGLLKVSERDARKTECENLLLSSSLGRQHAALQNSLSSATYLTQLISRCQGVGLTVDAAIRMEASNILWDIGETAASVRMLEDLVLQENKDSRHSWLGTQDIRVGKSEILAKLGFRKAESRLEQPDEIMVKYLAEAIKALKDVTEGDEAGQVFHEYAQFCDQQLQNADNLEDFERIKDLRDRKQREVEDLKSMISSTPTQSRERQNLESHRAKAKQWLTLDNTEYQRLLKSRQSLLCQSLENFLLCLKACDTYDGDALRFSALWLENFENDEANSAVGKYIDKVSSRKFARLMNQWTSRLANNSSRFQKSLGKLCLRICLDHPYHGMYQIFTSSKTGKNGKDKAAESRCEAAIILVEQIKRNKDAVSQIWMDVHNTNVNFVRFAAEKLEKQAKIGSKMALRNSDWGRRIEQDATSLRIPPPTMAIELRADCDYTSVSLITRFSSEFTIASGISMPKILTAIASDGRRYKQLFKSGNDDLRQDAIMEQVFAQVSSLLQTHRSTRQRSLSIRTYKVLPLTATAGIIEFVSNTTPLHDYLMPAHQRHYPHDYKTNVCRKMIADAQSKSSTERINVFKVVMDKFHPVMRYFFMERFENPDEWFQRRLAYTRSTAAISILGHVLGLGDRHGHNILLDEKTGEVVHIDLGIAFEQGRVLTVPEVVPFRLTRDLVDGMGITDTKGVFQRCCEFTLEALREDAYTIMTILDVLRYDPLYSWSLSPLRLRKVQREAQDGDEAEGAGGAKIEGDEGGKKENEPGEADRALTVVKKKLSKSLSVTATVNELIQQATDVRNLAVLFCGWAAYA